jgi:hypothetical protein
MPRAQWPLLHDRPVIEVVLTLVQGSQQVVRRLLADTGAGSTQAGFELLLDEHDCLLCGGTPLPDIFLGGAYSGSYPVYLIQVRIPLLGFDRAIPAVGVPAVPPGFDGIACFPFLNRFTYGNFADPTKFGLEI